MAMVDTLLVTLHLVFAGLWTGAVAFFSWRIHPLVVAGDIGVVPTERLLTGLRWLTRVGALVFLATGGHLAGTSYEFATLVGTGRGHLVLTMLGLWIVLTGLIEMLGAKMARQLDEGRLQTAGRETVWFSRAAGVVAVALLVVGGLLAA